VLKLYRGALVSNLTFYKQFLLEGEFSPRDEVKYEGVGFPMQRGQP